MKQMVRLVEGKITNKTGFVPGAVGYPTHWRYTWVRLCLSVLTVCVGALALLLSGGAGVSSVVLLSCPRGPPARPRLLLFFCSVCVVVSVVAFVRLSSPWGAGASSV